MIDWGGNTTYAMTSHMARGGSLAEAEWLNQTCGMCDSVLLSKYLLN